MKLRNIDLFQTSLNLITNLVGISADQSLLYINLSKYNIGALNDKTPNVSNNGITVHPITYILWYAFMSLRVQQSLCALLEFAVYYLLQISGKFR